MLRYSTLRIDGSSLQDLPDGSIKVAGQLTHTGVFSYRNPDGTERKEYRPQEEVFHKNTLNTFAGSPVTLNHPRFSNGDRLVSASTWKNVAIGHAGENIRQDGDHMVADLYIRDAAAVKAVKNGSLKHISLGYQVDYDPTPGTTRDGQRYDGVQRNIRGNHIALLPVGVAPRGGEDCQLRLDSLGDEIDPLNSNVELEALKAKVTALETELTKARTDAAEVEKLRLDLGAEKALVTELKASVAPERLDALVETRGVVVAAAKAAGVDPKGLSNLQIKRALVAKRTPALATRVDSLDESAVDAVLSVYETQPHPTMQLPDPNQKPAADTRTDAVPTISQMYEKAAKERQNDWKNNGDAAKPNRVN